MLSWVKNDVCVGTCVLNFWWSALLSADRWDLTVLDLLVWKSKEGSFTRLIGSLALQWTAFSYVWDSHVAKCNFVLQMQFHVSFWPAQKCSSMIFSFRCHWFLSSGQKICRLQNKHKLFFKSVVSITLSVPDHTWLMSLSFTDLKVKVPEVSGTCCPNSSTYILIILPVNNCRNLFFTALLRHMSSKKIK